MDQDSVLIRSLTLKNILSYGTEGQTISLGHLNVLIGPNGSGKSNLIDAIALLRASAKGSRYTGMNGGVSEWIWKGSPHDAAVIEAVINNPLGNQPLRHVFAFRAEQQAFRLDDERIENEKPYSGKDDPYFYYHFQKGRPVVNTKKGVRKLAPESVEPDVSILAQRRDPEIYPEITYLASVYN